MGKPGYTVTVSTDVQTFHFTSINAITGRTVEKRIEFNDTGLMYDNIPIYNLAFGDVNTLGKIDDEVQTNNGDFLMIMNTIWSSVYEFTKKQPNCSIYFSGSDEQRTEVYKKIISRKYKTILQDFDIYGIYENGDMNLFDPSENYDGFLLRRKLNSDEDR